MTPQVPALPGMTPLGIRPAYVVQKDAYDATRPYLVVATFRSFNRVKGRYETEAKARRRANDLNKGGR